MTPPVSAFSPTYFATGGGGGNLLTYSWRTNSNEGVGGCYLKIDRSGVGDASYLADDAATFQYWIKPTAAPDATLTVKYLGANYDGGANNRQSWLALWIYISGTLYVELFIRETSGGRTRFRWADPGITTSAWNFIAFTWDTSAGTEAGKASLIYSAVDGTPTDQGSPTIVVNGTVADVQDQGVGDFYIPQFESDGSADPTRHTDILLSDMRFYSARRTAANCAADWKTVPTGVESSLVEAWTLDNVYTSETGGETLSVVGTGESFETDVPY